MKNDEAYAYPHRPVLRKLWSIKNAMIERVSQLYATEGSLEIINGWNEYCDWSEVAWEAGAALEGRKQWSEEGARGTFVHVFEATALRFANRSIPVWVDSYPDERVARDLTAPVHGFRRPGEVSDPYWLHATRAMLLGDEALVDRVCEAAAPHREKIENARGKFHDKWMWQIPFSVQAALKGEVKDVVAQLKRQSYAYERYAKVAMQPAFAWHRCPVGDGEDSLFFSFDYSAMLILKLFPGLRPPEGTLCGVPRYELIDLDSN